MERMLMMTKTPNLSAKFCRTFLVMLQPSSLVRFLSALIIATLLPIIAFANTGITYHGRILKADGTPLNGNNVRFKIQIRTPGTENCLLYEEIQTRNMANSGGAFALTINDRTGILNFAAAPFPDLFSNRKAFTLTSPACVYTPTASDTRKLVVAFKDETMLEWESMGIQTINAAPVALQAQQIDGFPAKSLLRVEDSGITIDTDPLTQNQYDELVRLVMGTSTVYSRRTQLAGANLPATTSMTNGQSIRWNGTQWEAFTPSTGSGSGTVTSVTAGTGLATTPGAGITTTGSIGIADGGVGTNQLADGAVTTAKILDAQVSTAKLADASVTGVKLEDVATAGTYNSVTIDAKGRVVSGSNAASTTSGTIGGTTVINTSGAITTTGNLSVGGTSTLTGNVSAGGNVAVTGDVSAANITATNMTATNLSATGVSTRLVRVYDSDSSNYVDVLTPATGVLTSNYSFVLPSYNLA